ncbi:unnamed protein product [Agarophyton chilense]
MEDSSSSSASSSPQRQGLGFSQFPPSSPSTSSASVATSSDGEVPGLSAAFGGRRSRSKKRRRSPSPGLEQRPGAWEAHTRGIGSKILAKQGFTGRLGRHGDGIAEPLQPVMRRGKVGLGADQRKEESQKKNRTRNTLHDLDAEIEAANTRIQSKLKTVSTEKEETSTRMYEPMRHDLKPVSVKVWDEISEKLSGARRTVTVISPQLMYDLNRLRDTAMSQLSTALRAKQQEEIILQNTASEKEKAQDNLERIKAELNELVALENALAGLESPNGVAYERALKKLADTVSQVGDRFHVGRQSVSAALAELVCRTVIRSFHECLKNSQKHGKADKKSAGFVGGVLKTVKTIISSDEYTKLCAVSILGPLRRVFSRTNLDIVRGACIADVLVKIRPMISDALIQVFAEELLLPRLVAHIKITGRTGEKHVPTHVWIHPWLPVAGRKALVEVLHHVRISLTSSLEAWKISDSNLQRADLIDITKKWSAVLSRKKLQLALSRHVVPKLAAALCQIDGNTSEVLVGFEALSDWASVCSSRILAAELAEPFIKGPGTVLRSTAFKDWEGGRQLYRRWNDCLPSRFKYHFRPVLAALLFVLDAAATANQGVRARLLHADITPLLKNRFQKVNEKKTKIARPVVPARRARLVDVVAMVAEKEGIPLVGLPDERGQRVFKLGRIRITIDVGRGVFLHGGKIVGVDELVELAKA